MDILEQTILESVENIDKVTIESELNVLQAMGDSYIKQLQLIRECNDETVLEQYDIFTEAESGETTEKKQSRDEKNPLQANGFWRENDKGVFKKILAFIPRLFEAIGRAIKSAFAKDKVTPEELEKNANESVAVIAEIPEVKDAVAAADNETEENMNAAAKDKSGTAKKVLFGTAIAAMVGAIAIRLGVKVSELSEEEGGAKSLAGKETLALFKNATGAVVTHVDINAIITDLKNIQVAIKKIANMKIKNPNDYRFPVDGYGLFKINYVKEAYNGNGKVKKDTLVGDYMTKGITFKSAKLFKEKTNEIKAIATGISDDCKKISETFAPDKRINKLDPKKLEGYKVNDLRNSGDFESLVRLSNIISGAMYGIMEIYTDMNEQVNYKSKFTKKDTFRDKLRKFKNGLTGAKEGSKLTKGTGLKGRVIGVVAGAKAGEGLGELKNMADEAIDKVNGVADNAEKFANDASDIFNKGKEAFDDIKNRASDAVKRVKGSGK